MFVKADKPKESKAQAQTHPTTQRGGGIRLRRILHYQYFGGEFSNVAAGLIRYAALNGYAHIAAEINAQTPIEKGVFDRLAINMAQNLVDGNTIITLRKNGANTDLTKTIAAGVNGVFSVEAYVPVEDGDLVNFVVNCAGSAAGSVYVIPLLRYRRI